MKTLAILFAVFLTIGFRVVEAPAESSVGMITELSGPAWIDRAEQRLEAEIGRNLLPDDRLTLDKGSRMSMLIFQACDEWIFSGPDHIRIETDSPPISETHPRSTPAATFDICFDPASFMSVSHGRLGGIAVRSDPVNPQRTKADHHTASAAELLTVILYDLKRGETQKAKPYYDMLSEKLSSGPLLDALSVHFR